MTRLRDNHARILEKNGMLSLFASGCWRDWDTTKGNHDIEVNQIASFVKKVAQYLMCYMISASLDGATRKSISRFRFQKEKGMIKASHLIF